MEILFYISLFGIIYSYLIYPLILLLTPNKAKITPFAPKKWPRVDLIITAHNEQNRITEKLNNSLAIEYPRDKIEIIVASDCSTDDTDDVVYKYAAQGVKLVRADHHLGKEYAQYCAIQKTNGEIIVFSDVATMIPADAIKKMVGYFSNPNVGAVSSEDRFISEGGKIVGEGAYVRYEMWLRHLESSRSGLVGLSGSFFATRRKVCEQEWDTHSPSDFNTAITAAGLGLVSISSPDVVGHYKDLKDERKEYPRKVRTVIRGITAISRHVEVLNFKIFGLFSFQVWSHKIMRWAVPWFLILAFLSNWAIAKENLFYSLTLALQFSIYLATIIAWKAPTLKKSAAIRLIYFFLQSNLAIFDATLRFMCGKRMTVWTPSAR
ncbi:glycosyltransferase [Porticoccus sp. GXU_MW_L64]